MFAVPPGSLILGLVGLAFAACATDDAGVEAPPRSQLSFAPAAAKIGDELTVTGEDFPGTEVDVLLIPGDQSDRLFEARQNGELYVLASATLDEGNFSIDLRLPASVKSEGGELVLVVVPGRYEIGASAEGHMASVGYLVVQ